MRLHASWSAYKFKFNDYHVNRDKVSENEMKTLKSIVVLPCFLLPQKKTFSEFLPTSKEFLLMKLSKKPDEV